MPAKSSNPIRRGGWPIRLSTCPNKYRNEFPALATFVLEPYGKLVKLTLTHEGFDEGSKMLPAISKGWPAILSSLKSMLETGQPLEMPFAALKMEEADR